ncbi:uncharacterized protein LOC141670730 [Apium graveolens]|uniref:uncharacterized protein LOC141670730 n=1 Tax=Apium graveolens TaxID=4045 RepID=UPI003D78EF0D
MHLPDVYFNSKTFGENSYEFEKFVDMVLTQREKSDHELRSLSFCWTFKSKIPQPLLDRVHCYAQSHDVRCFDFSTGCVSGHRSYPSQNFNPKSLTTLRLNLSHWYGHFLRTEENLNLRDKYLAGCTALKTLWLETFTIEIKSGDVDLFSSLVNLTELRIVGCYIVGKDRHFHIRSPRLERLTLFENVDYMGRAIIGAAPHWAISAPLLKYLRIDVWLSLFSLGHLPSVEELEIHFQTHMKSGATGNPFLARTVIDIIKRLPHVKSLTLSKSALQVLSAFPSVLLESPCPKFKWKFLKVITTEEFHTILFPEYLRGLAYLRKNCSKALKVQLTTQTEALN